MSSLKNETVNKCFSLLREYIAEGPQDNKKETAILALHQLQKITAGLDTPGSYCTGKPRFDGNPDAE